MSQHFVVFAKECGHVVSQCRCPSPTKVRRYVNGLCAGCRASGPRTPTEKSDPEQRDLKGDPPR